MTPLPPPATDATMYFVGVTTGKSSIMKVFPRWAAALGIDAVLKGIDLPIHAPGDDYRRVVRFIKQDPLSVGALVTTHKIDLLAAARDLFDGLGPHASLLSEVSSISKRGGQLWGHAKDPVTSGLALEAFLPEKWWKRTQAETLIFGAGGSALALTIYLMDPRHGANRPGRIVVTNRSQPRLAEMQRIHAQLAAGDPRWGVDCRYRHCPAIEDNDRQLEQMPEGSLVVNATGLGKDRPGSPIGDDGRFPKRALAWDFNYRGDLGFLTQARRHERLGELTVEDGWVYFIHGWTQVIAEVFGVEIDAEKLAELDRLATEVGRPPFPPSKPICQR